MAEVSINGTDLVVRMEGLDKLWALKSHLVIPLANVRGATVDPGIVKERKGIRAPGTHFPRVITAGTFHIDGERVFWDVRNPDKAVVIELVDERYARLVVEVDSPANVVTMIEGACAH
ncbi:hypothetical protein [Nocardia lijiangensis]|uniref:hypothetical protein n=1 Tax=Nocardia lijiangensis TaxID=299618 RepID=UPI00082B56CA|nr:hypothetical protein [Nocardia lijiangensis]